MKRVYLAGPWFKPEQMETIKRMETMMEFRHIPFFSPRIECLCPPDATKEQADYSFQMNKTGIKEAAYVLARIDDFDPGTIWEMGHAHERVPVYAFTTVENRGLNLMLTSGGVRIIQGWDKLAAFLDGDDSAAIVWEKIII